MTNDDEQMTDMDVAHKRIAEALDARCRQAKSLGVWPFDVRTHYAAVIDIDGDLACLPLQVSNVHGTWSLSLFGDLQTVKQATYQLHR